VTIGIRRLDASIGDALTTDVADYEVTIETAKGVMAFTPVPANSTTAKRRGHGESLRG